MYMDHENVYRSWLLKNDHGDEANKDDDEDDNDASMKNFFE